MDDLKLKLSTNKDIKDYFEKNKIKNIMLFSLARSGSTFLTNSKKTIKNY